MPNSPFKKGELTERWQDFQTKLGMPQKQEMYNFGGFTGWAQLV